MPTTTIGGGGVATALNQVSPPPVMLTQGTGGTDLVTATAYTAFRFNTGTTVNNIGHVSVFMSKDAGITTGSNIKAELYTDSANLPGTLVTLNGMPDHATGYLFYPYDLPTGAASTEVKFFLPVTGLSANTNYWVVFSHSLTGGQVHFDSRASGSNLWATSADKSAWAGVAKELRYVIYGISTLNILSQSNDNFGAFLESDSFQAVRGHSVYGFGVYGFSTHHYGVGGNSQYLTGVRGSTTYGYGVQGESLNSTGGQFQSDAGVNPALQGAHLSVGAGVQGFSNGGDFLQGASFNGVGWRVGPNFENIVQPPTAVVGGATFTDGYFAESVTLNTGATFTDTATSIPAGSLVYAVAWRILTTITVVTAFQIGTAANLTNFQASTATLTAGTTGIGINQFVTGGLPQGLNAATKVRLNFNGNPGAGVVRVVVWYRTFTAPTA